MSVHYSAEAPGRNGRVVCHVVRRHALHAQRAQYTIAVRNETDINADVLVFATDAFELRYRTIVQATIVASADFSTTIELEVARYGSIPTLHVEVSGDDIEFDLVIPNVGTSLGEEALAHAARAALTGGDPVLSIASSDRVRDVSAPVAPPPASPPTVPQTSAAIGQALVPWERLPPTLPSTGVALGFVALLAVVLLAAGVLWLSRPTIAALLVPDVAHAGASIAIAYRTTGNGQVAYRVTGPDGQSVARGFLRSGMGTFDVRLPVDSTAPAYRINVSMDGPLGTQSADAYVKVVAIANAAPTPARVVRVAPAALVPQIRSLALDRAVFSGGGPLNVFYDVWGATSGTVALIDPASQIMYGSSALAASGRTAFILPAVENERNFTVVVTARRGLLAVQSRVAVLVQPSPMPSPSPSVDGLQPGDQADGTAPLVTVPEKVVGGQPIVVTIRGQVTDVVVTLVDENGREVARQILAPAQSAVTLTAPRVRVPSKYAVQISYAQGAGSEMLVRSVTVTPHSN